MVYFMNNFVFKAIEKQLKKNGVLRIVKVDYPAVSNNMEYAAFFEFNDKVFSTWCPIEYESAESDLDIEHACNTVIHFINLEKKHISERLFIKVVNPEDPWAYMSGWGLSNFIFKQLFNFYLVKKDKLKLYDFSPSTR